MRKTRRAPKTSAIFPAVGCAIALARYSAVTREAVCPTETCRPTEIGTSAVAIMELLTAFRAAPMNSGVVNRHVNGFPVKVDPPVWLGDVMWLRFRPVRVLAVLDD
jgi:hypothetical protein